MQAFTYVIYCALDSASDLKTDMFKHICMADICSITNALRCESFGAKTGVNG